MKTTKQLARELGLLRQRKLSSASGDGQKQRKICQQFHYLVVIDFESTCWDRDKTKTQEIIEFPAVLLNTGTGQIESEFHYYVQPEEHPTLSAFCNQLTGISQEEVDNGIPLSLCLRKFSHWLHKLLKEKGIRLVGDGGGSGDGEKGAVHQAAIVTWSDWDLGVCLHYEVKRKQIPKSPCFNQWIDLRATYTKFYDRKPKGLNGALQDVGIEFEGREHSGLHDSRNTAYLAWRMIRDGCIMTITKTMITPANSIGGNQNATQSVSGCGRSGKQRKTPKKKTPKKSDKRAESSGENLKLGEKVTVYMDSDCDSANSASTNGGGDINKTGYNSECIGVSPKGLRMRNENIPTPSLNGSPCKSAQSDTASAFRLQKRQANFTPDKSCIAKCLRLSALTPTKSRSISTSIGMGKNSDDLSVCSSVAHSKDSSVYSTSNVAKPSSAMSSKSAQGLGIPTSNPVKNGFKTPSPPQQHVIGKRFLTSSANSVRAPSPQQSTLHGRSTQSFPRNGTVSNASCTSTPSSHIGSAQNVLHNGAVSANASSSRTPSPLSHNRSSQSVLHNGIVSANASTFRTPSPHSLSIGLGSFKTPSPVSHSIGGGSEPFKTPSPSSHSLGSGPDTFKTPSPVSHSIGSGSGPFKTPQNPPFASSSTMKATPPLCKCGRRAKRRMVQNPGPNMGRWFFSCVKGSASSSHGGKSPGCGFFKWEITAGAFDANQMPSPRFSGSASGSFLKSQCSTSVLSKQQSPASSAFTPKNTVSASRFANSNNVRPSSIPRFAAVNNARTSTPVNTARPPVNTARLSTPVNTAKPPVNTATAANTARISTPVNTARSSISTSCSSSVRPRQCNTNSTIKTTRPFTPVIQVPGSQTASKRLGVSSCSSLKPSK